VKLQDDFDAFYCVVDLHAITAGGHDPASLEASTRTSAAIYLAAGVDPDKANVFVQSHVPAHSELCWLLNCVAPIGWLEKMILFKEKAKKAGEEVSVGFVGLSRASWRRIFYWSRRMWCLGGRIRGNTWSSRETIAGQVNFFFGGKKWKKR
jgi:Tryptophanyl-tRNA synthetase